MDWLVVAGDAEAWYWKAENWTRLKDIATVAVVLGGGWWVWRQRERYPRACVTQTVRSLPLDDAHTYVQVQTTLSNVGKVMISVENHDTSLFQVLPFPERVEERLRRTGRLAVDGQSEADWPGLARLEVKHPRGEAEIEPGESEQFFDDFVVDSSVQTAGAYTYFKNTAKRRRLPAFWKAREIGWKGQTLFALRTKGAEPMGQDQGVRLLEQRPPRQFTSTAVAAAGRQMPPKQVPATTTTPTTTSTEPKPHIQMPPKKFDPPPTKK